MRVFIGYDEREHKAYTAAVGSLVRRSPGVDVVPLDLSRLRATGLYRRPLDTRGGLFDLNSGAPQSTEFAISRFFVPMLAHAGVVLFTDCDVIFLRDVRELLDLADPTKAVQVVKHAHEGLERRKMDGVPQTRYWRKNWSSVMLVNCDHPAHKRLSLDALNNWPGRDLHAFGWLADEEIGDLPGEWNWLVNVQPKPVHPAIAHYTLGGPWFPDWVAAPHDELWMREYEESRT